MSKKPISATIDENLIRWIDDQLKDSAKYRNKSHLIEIALNKLRKDKDQGVK
jgi:Arc/MetJ-type ribon-helix-helix transcriptional regulator